MIDTEKAALERRIDELCQENEQMRKTASMLANARTTLLAENKELRELVHGFAIYRHFDCQHCGYREQCEAGQTNCYKAYVDLIKRARQMGIEVDA